MNNPIPYFLEYVQAVIGLQGNEQKGLMLWLAEIYSAIDDKRVIDANQLIRGAKKFGLSEWGKAQVFLGQGDFYASLQSWDEAVGMYQNALSLLELSHSPDDERAVVTNNLGLVYQNQGMYDDAQRCFETALTFYENVGNLDGKIHAISNLASVFDERGDWSKAIQNYEQGIKLLSQSGKKEDLASLLNNVGVVYQKAGQIVQAETILQRCVDLLDETGLAHSPHGVRVLMNLGEVYATLGQAHQAIHCLESAISICQELSDADLEISVWNNLGTIYLNQNDTINAISCFSKSLELGREFLSWDTQALALSNLGAAYEELRENDKALMLYEQSLALSQDIHDLYGIARAQNNIGVLFEKQGDFHQAILHYEQARNKLHEISDYYRETIAVINIASLYARMNDISRAWEWHQLGYQLANKHAYTDLLVSLEVLNGDLNFSSSSKLDTGCNSYARACELALLSNPQSLYKFMEIARQRSEWLDDEGRNLFCQRLLEKCGDALKRTVPDFYEHLASGGKKNAS